MSADTGRKGAILVFNGELLAKLLQLPEGAQVEQVSVPIDKPGTLEVRISGAGWSHEPGAVLPRFSGVAEPVAWRIDWGMWS
jgi:hypothetical protein